MKTLYLTLLFFLFVNFTVTAQELSTEIRGKVTTNDEELIGVPIRAVSASGEATSIITDENGNYSIKNLKAGMAYTIRVTYVGCQEQGFKDIILKPGEVYILNIKLKPLGSTELNEIVVTGRAGSGSRNKISTSYSITNIGYNALSMQAPTSVTETLKSIPGFWVESSGGEASGNVRARGVPVDGYGSIQLLEDGIPVQHDPALGYLNADQVFRFDETIQSVEVVRGGPSSIFYSNAPAGAVNYIPRMVQDKAEGIFKLTMGDGSLFRKDFWVGVPINDWKLSLGGFYRTGKGARNAGFTGNNGGQIRVSLGRQWEKTSFNVDFKRLDDNVILYLGIPMVKENGKIVAVPGFNGHTGTIAGPETQKINMIQGDGSVYNFDNTVGTQVKRNQLTTKFSADIFDKWTLKNTFRYSKTATQRNGVFPNTLQSASSFIDSQSDLLKAIPGAQALGLQYVTSGDMFNTTNQNGNGLMILGGLRGLTLPLTEVNNDFNLSRIFKIGKSKHDFNFGFYFSHFEEDFNRYSSVALLDVQNNAKLLNLVALDNNGKVIETLTDNGIFRYGYEFENAHGEQTTNAIYVSDEWEITPELRIDGGFRWEHTQTQGVVEQKQNVDLGTFATSNITTGNGLFLGYNHTFKHTTWTLGLNYQFSYNMGLFARYTSAARMPGLGSYVTNVKATPVIQTMNLGEIGYKYGSEKLYFYATGFYTKYNNVGFTNYVFNLDGSNNPQNLYANTQTLGFELEGGYFPAKWFDITATSTLQSGKYRNFVYTNQAGEHVNYNGKQLIRIPAVSFRVVPGFNLFGERLRLQVPIEYEGKRYVDVANSVVLPNYVKVDVNAQINITDKITLLGVIDNINNSLGLTEGNPRQGEVQNNDYGAKAFIARPLVGRSYKVSLRYKF